MAGGNQAVVSVIEVNGHGSPGRVKRRYIADTSETEPRLRDTGGIARGCLEELIDGTLVVRSCYIGVAVNFQPFRHIAHDVMHAVRADVQVDGTGHERSAGIEQPARGVRKCLRIEVLASGSVRKPTAPVAPRAPGRRQ